MFEVPLMVLQVLFDHPPVEQGMEIEREYLVQGIQGMEMDEFGPYNRSPVNNGALADDVNSPGPHGFTPNPLRSNTFTPNNLGDSGSGEWKGGLPGSDIMDLDVLQSPTRKLSNGFGELDDTTRVDLRIEPAEPTRSPLGPFTFAPALRFGPGPSMPCLVLYSSCTRSLVAACHYMSVHNGVSISGCKMFLSAALRCPQSDLSDNLRAWENGTPAWKDGIKYALNNQAWEACDLFRQVLSSVEMLPMPVSKKDLGRWVEYYQSLYLHRVPVDIMASFNQQQPQHLTPSQAAAKPPSGLRAFSSIRSAFTQ
eukprot:gene4194-4502_t